MEFKMFLFVLFVELGTVSFNKGDEDLINNQINITKTYYRTDRQDVITQPKTKKSVRVVEIPEFLSKEIKEFVDGLYGMPDDERLFTIVQEAVQHKMKNYIKKAVQTVTLERDNLLKQLLQSQKHSKSRERNGKERTDTDAELRDGTASGEKQSIRERLEVYRETVKQREQEQQLANQTNKTIQGRGR